MGYLHCPACSRAYNVSREPACPSCGAGATRSVTPAPARDLAGRIEDLMQALADAAPDEREAAEATLATRIVMPGHALLRTSSPVMPAHEHRLVTAARSVARVAARELGGVLRSASSRAYAKFLAAKSQFTSVQNASQNLGRAFR